MKNNVSTFTKNLFSGYCFGRSKSFLGQLHLIHKIVWQNTHPEEPQLQRLILLRVPGVLDLYKNGFHTVNADRFKVCSL